MRTENAGRHAIGVFDETSYVKKRDKTPGVKRQWCGTVGKEENCTVTVHLSYACGEFHCLLDGELFLPEDWSADRQRCREAGIPEAISYRPKWQIALELLDRAVSRGIHFEWLTFDEGYGGKPGFLRGLAGATSSSSARSPAISPVGSRLPAWSHDRSIARDVGAGVRFRGWLPTDPEVTECQVQTALGALIPCWWLDPTSLGQATGADGPGDPTEPAQKRRGTTEPHQENARTTPRVRPLASRSASG